MKVLETTKETKRRYKHFKTLIRNAFQNFIIPQFAEKMNFERKITGPAEIFRTNRKSAAPLPAAGYDLFGD